MMLHALKSLFSILATLNVIWGKNVIPLLIFVDGEIQVWRCSVQRHPSYECRTETKFTVREFYLSCLIRDLFWLQCSYLYNEIEMALKKKSPKGVIFPLCSISASPYVLLMLSFSKASSVIFRCFELWDPGTMNTRSIPCRPILWAALPRPDNADNHQLVKLEIQGDRWCFKDEITNNCSVFFVYSFFSVFYSDPGSPRKIKSQWNLRKSNAE